MQIRSVILAGGQGARFWPISRRHKPKQFLSINSSGESLIQATARRIEPLAGKDNLIVVTEAQLEPLIREHVSYAKVIGEPMRRNTAASIGLAAAAIAKQDPNIVMACFPADHAVADEPKLLAVLREAATLAAKHDVLVTIGIRPSFPHTGYGYMKRGAPIAGNGYAVSRFYEKPNLERAKRYFESGEFFWNSGMFVWRAGVILEAFREFMPQLYDGLMKIQAAMGTPQEKKVMKDVFDTLESISIDFGVLEHARNCALLAAEPFGWNDVGSWDAWAENFETDSQKNLLHGDALVIDCRNCVVHSQQRLTAVIGAQDLVIIDSGDALLVCPRSHVQDVRKIVDELKKRNRENLT
jgi:mannose-1-phosphate guanylyltransferase